MSLDALVIWRQMVEHRNPRSLDSILADDAAFYSPIVHAPKISRKTTRAYLAAMFSGFFNDSFRYVLEATGPNSAVLERCAAPCV